MSGLFLALGIMTALLERVSRWTLDAGHADLDNDGDGLPDTGDKCPIEAEDKDGFQDRDRYTILTLFRPGRSWKPWAPQEQWNGKVVVPHGGNCGASYTPGEPRLDDYSGTIPSEDLPVAAYEQSYVAALGKLREAVDELLDHEK